MRRFMDLFFPGSSVTFYETIFHKSVPPGVRALKTYTL